LGCHGVGHYFKGNILEALRCQPAIHPKQLRTHLVPAKLQLGLVLNFGLERMKEGITRIANGLPEETNPRSEGE
jgi:hypothetical protein